MTVGWLQKNSVCELSDRNLYSMCSVIVSRCEVYTSIIRSKML